MSWLTSYASVEAGLPSRQNKTVLSWNLNGMRLCPVSQRLPDSRRQITREKVQTGHLKSCASNLAASTLRKVYIINSGRARLELPVTKDGVTSQWLYGRKITSGPLRCQPNTKMDTDPLFINETEYTELCVG